MTKAESKAEEVVFDFDLTLPIKPSDVCNELTSDIFPIKYQERHLSSSKFCGISIGNMTSGAEILINDAIENQGRKKFTAAHEIGHVLMHIQTGQQSQFECTQNDIEGRGGNNKKFEKEANEFASSLLMPKSLIGSIISRNDLSWQLVQSIYGDCQTSLEATARRAVRLSNEACALIIHKQGEMWAPVKSTSFPAYINKTLFPKHLKTSPDGANNNFSDEMSECDASDWLTNSKDIPDTIFYSSIRNEEYDRLMTFIVIPEVDEDEDDEWEDPKFR
jgi:hypothetical protein